MREERPTIMTVNELAKYLRLHEQTVYKMAKDGRLPAYKVGNRWRFKKDMIDSWLRDQRGADLLEPVGLPRS
ncbi:MAG: helix-turn-helix domain-containing protein [Actinomycetota bacterium]